MAAKAKVQHMAPQVGSLSASIISAFFNGEDAQKTQEKVAQVEGSRMQWLFRYFPNSTVADVKEAVKGFKAQAEEEHGKKSPAYKSASNRAGDIQALYGAYRFANWKPDGMGYQKATEAARAILVEKSLKWDGNHKPTDTEKADRKAAENVGKQAAMVELERREFERANPGVEITPEKIEEFRAQVAESVKRAGAVKMADAIFEKHGHEFSGWLVERLEALVHEAEQAKAEQDKAEKRKAA
jgi:hypothetical protein